jgi:hypothetical protein
MLFLDMSCRSERTVMSAYPDYAVLYSSAECSTVCTVQVRRERERERIVVHTVQPHRRGNASKSGTLVLSTEDCCMRYPLVGNNTLHGLLLPEVGIYCTWG